MEHYSDKFGTTLKVGDRVIYPVLNKQGQLYKFESGKILSIKEGGGRFKARFLISPSMELISQSYIIKYDYPVETSSLDPMVQEWLNNLYTEAIEEAEQSIKNERIWEKGYNGEEDNPHTENISTIEQYISVLTGLRATTQAQTTPKQTRKEVLYDAMLGYLVELINKNDLVATLKSIGFTKSELEKEGILEEEE